MQDKSSYKNYKKEIKDLKLRFITGRSQRQVPIFQWQGIGPARTGRSAAPGGVTAAVLKIWGKVRSEKERLASMAIKSAKTVWQDLIKAVGIKSIEELFGGMVERSLKTPVSRHVD